MFTQERAKEVIKQQSQFPNWGNFTKFMTDEEIEYVRDLWQKAPSDLSSFATTVYKIAAGDKNETL